MKFTAAIDQFFTDMRAYGRINSPGTETAYRQVLEAHARDVDNRDPANTTREHVKATLERWPHPNTRRARQAALTSFYDWAMEEGVRRDNPARQVRRPKAKPTDVYRLTRGEAAAMLRASMPIERERWAIHLGLLTGERSAELRHLRASDFMRPGFVRILGKGQKVRWVPVITDLEPIVAEILARLAPDDHVLCGSKAGGGAHGSPDYWRENRDKPMSSQMLQRIVHRVAAAAGIHAHIHPHLMRHAYGDHIAKHAGLHNAQALLGHADVSTTAGTYTGKPSLEELAAAIKGFGFLQQTTPTADEERTDVPHLLETEAFSLSGEGGIRTLGQGAADDPGQGLEQNADPDIPIAPGGPTLRAWLAPLDLERKVALYKETFS